MALEIDWRILRVWKDTNGFITTVEFTAAFTSDQYPGVSSLHGGVVGIAHAALNADTATRQEIADAIMETTGDVVGLSEFHLNQLRFEYERKHNEVVVIDGEDMQPPMPKLTARQLRLGLVTNGITLSSVEATIAAIPDDTDREVAMIEWEYASEFDRGHHLILQVGTALGLTEAQIDSMWMAASTL